HGNAFVRLLLRRHDALPLYRQLTMVSISLSFFSLPLCLRGGSSLAITPPLFRELMSQALFGAKDEYGDIRAAQSESPRDLIIGQVAVVTQYEGIAVMLWQLSDGGTHRFSSLARNQLIERRCRQRDGGRRFRIVRHEDPLLGTPRAQPVHAVVACDSREPTPKRLSAIVGLERPG